MLDKPRNGDNRKRGKPRAHGPKTNAERPFAFTPNQNHAPHKHLDWHAIEQEFRVGTLSIHAIATKHGCADASIRKHAIKHGWTRNLSERVREQVAARLALSGSHEAREAAIDKAANEGVALVLAHRRDLDGMTAAQNKLVKRLNDLLDKGETDGLALGDKETLADMLDKLSRVTSRLIPLQRQAFGLPEERETGPSAAVTVQIVRFDD